MARRSGFVGNVVRTVVFWAILLAAALFPAWYINSAFGYLAFLIFLILLVFSQIHVFLVKRGLAVERGKSVGADDGAARGRGESVGADNGTERGRGESAGPGDGAERTREKSMSADNGVECTRGEAVGLGLRIHNTTPLYAPYARASLYISDLFGGVDACRETDFTIAARADSKFDFGMDMRHIGVYRVGLKNLRIYDIFGISYRQVPLGGEFEVYVKPNIYPMEDLEVEEEVLLDSSRDTRNAVPNGTDYVGVREYTPGDSMKQIHWKLSAHSIHYMTKLSESSRQSDFAVLVDFAAPKAEREELMDLNDALLETAFSLLEELSHREVTYSLVYADRQQEIRRSTPRGRQNDREYIRRFDIIHPEPEAGYPDGAELMRQEGRMPNRSTDLFVCTSRITPELIRELVSVKRQKRCPNLYVILPARLSSRERENALAPLRDLDDLKIPWHIVLTRHDAANGKNQGQKPASGSAVRSGGEEPEGASQEQKYADGMAARTEDDGRERNREL